MTEIDLDSVIGCRQELEYCSRELARLNVKYAERLRDLAVAELELSQAEAFAFLKADGSTATERKAQATAVLSERDDDLAGLVARLEGESEALKVLTKGLEARGSRAQSAINSHLAEERLSGYRREG